MLNICFRKQRIKRTVRKNKVGAGDYSPRPSVTVRTNRHWLRGYLSVRIWRYGRIDTSYFFLLVHATYWIAGSLGGASMDFYCDWLDPKRISYHSFFFSIQMPLGMTTELQPILRPIWETTARLTLHLIVNALGWGVHVDMTTLGNKQRVLMHRHQGWNVRHGLCHIYMRYLYIYELFIAFVCFVVCSLL